MGMLMQMRPEKQDSNATWGRVNCSRVTPCSAAHASTFRIQLESGGKHAANFEVELCAWCREAQGGSVVGCWEGIDAREFGTGKTWSLEPRAGEPSEGACWNFVK